MVSARRAGLLLRKARADQTQEQFAAQLGITRAALANYEVGRTRAPFDVLAACGIDIGAVAPEPPSPSAAAQGDALCKAIEEVAVARELMSGALSRLPACDDTAGAAAAVEMVAAQIIRLIAIHRDA